MKFLNRKLLSPPSDFFKKNHSYFRCHMSLISSCVAVTVLSKDKKIDTHFNATVSPVSTINSPSGSLLQFQCNWEQLDETLAQCTRHTVPISLDVLLCCGLKGLYRNFLHRCKLCSFIWWRPSKSLPLVRFVCIFACFCWGGQALVRIVASKSLRHRWHDLSPQIGGLCDEAGIETSLSMRERGEVLPRDGIKEQKVGRWPPYFIRPPSGPLVLPRLDTKINV